MSFTLSGISRARADRAPFMVIHGEPGIGKTTFAAGFPSPVFIQTEDGLGTNEADAFPLVKEYENIVEALEALYEDTDHETVVIDTASALEPIIWDKVAASEKKKSIEDIGYGKGYVLALTYWREVIAACQGLTRLGKTVLVLAHTEVTRFDPPDATAYDRYQVKLHRKAMALLIEQADLIGFAHVPVYVAKDDDKAKKGKAKAKSGRQLVVSPSPAIIAKNRYNLDGELSLTWDAIRKAIPFYSSEAASDAATEEEEEADV